MVFKIDFVMVYPKLDRRKFLQIVANGVSLTPTKHNYDAIKFYNTILTLSEWKDHL